MNIYGYIYEDYSVIKKNLNPAIYDNMDVLEGTMLREINQAEKDKV